MTTQGEGPSEKSPWPEPCQTPECMPQAKDETRRDISEGRDGETDHLKKKVAVNGTKRSPRTKPGMNWKMSASLSKQVATGGLIKSGFNQVKKRAS